MKKAIIMTALVAAAILAAGCPANVQELAANGDLTQLESQVQKDPAKVNAQDSLGRSPLHAACGKGQVETVTWLLAHGADVNLSDKDGDRPLHYAVMGGHLEICRLLIDAGAEPEARNKNGATPLHVAADRSVELTAFFIESGVAVDITDKDGDTPLYYASLAQKQDIVRFLVEKGADINHHNETGKTPLMHFIELGSLAQLFDIISNPNRSHKFELRPYEQMADLLIELGADVNAVDKEGQTALHLAASSRRFQELAFFVGPLGSGVQVLMVENPEAVKILLDLGAAIEAIDNNGRTPLHIAAMNNHPECAKKLIYNGADMNARDKNNLTPLGLAKLKPEENKDVITVLINRGAKT